MGELAEMIGASLAKEYKSTADALHKWADPLTQEQFWKNPFGYGNSVGHLVLHITGNLSYYLGTQIAKTGYLRNRDQEFTEANQPPKEEVLRKFDEAISMVVATSKKQSGEDWQKEYSAERELQAKDRFTIFLRCASHAYHHVGQVIYLRRELDRQVSSLKRVEARR
ncbi:MAG: hypothetical protein PVS2B2_06880 [Candidatus Acidiferrum sp.]